MSSIIRVALEDISGIDITTTEPLNIDEHMEDMSSANDELTRINQSVILVQNSTSALNELTSDVASMEEPDEVALEALWSAINGHRRIVNEAYGREMLPDPLNYSLEGFISASPSNMDHLLQGLFNAWKMASRAFQDAVTMAYNLAERFIRNVKDLRAKLAASRSMRPRNDTMMIRGCAQLHYKGKTDLPSIITGFKNAEKVLDAVTGVYREAIYRHYKDTAAAFVKSRAELGFLVSHSVNKDLAVASTIIEKFKNDTNKSLQVALKTAPGNLEISGGRLFTLKSSDYSTSPTIFVRDSKIAVDNAVQIPVPSKKQIEEMLDLIEGVSYLVHSRKTNMFKTTYEIHQAVNIGMAQSADANLGMVRRFLSRLETYAHANLNHIWYAAPIADTTQAVFSASRKLLRFCDDAIALY